MSIIGSLILLVGCAFALAVALRPATCIAAQTRSNSVVLGYIALPAVLLFAFVLVALRPEHAGYDTAHYIEAYEGLGSVAGAFHDGKAIYGNTELLWWPIQALLRPLLDSRSWLVVNFIAVCLLTFTFYRKAAPTQGVSSALFFLVFLTFYLVYTGNAMRQAAALPVAGIAVFFAAERRYVPWLICTAVSVGLHWSTAVVLAAPLVHLGALNKDRTYIYVLCAALLFSPLLGKVLALGVTAVSHEGLSHKYDLYFDGGRTSHIAAVWKTLNFWLCTVVGILFLMLKRPSCSSDRTLHFYVLLFLSLSFLGISSPDFAERYLPALLLVLPLLVASLIMSAPAPTALRNITLLFGFLGMGVLITMNESARITLGLGA